MHVLKICKYTYIHACMFNVKYSTLNSTILRNHTVSVKEVNKIKHHSIIIKNKSKKLTLFYLNHVYFKMIVHRTCMKMVYTWFNCYNDFSSFNFIECQFFCIQGTLTFFSKLCLFYFSICKWV